MQPSILRKGVVEALEFASSFKAQLQYEDSVPIANVLAEIFCIWEDIYHPQVDAFKDAFSESESKALEAYNEKLSDIAASSKAKNLKEFQNSAEGLSLARAAAETLVILCGR